jgi:hypothetical protein
MTAPTHEINQYIAEIDKIYRSGKGTEHSYRPALKVLFEALFEQSGSFARQNSNQRSACGKLNITNEPKRIACGAPNYIITKGGIPGDIPVGYIEAKDIPVGVHNKLNKEQFDRYKQSLNNLIITDYLTFELFADGLRIFSVSIVREKSGTIQADKKQYPAFAEFIAAFTGFQGKTIYQSEQLGVCCASRIK